MLIIFSGLPGVGKTTIAKMLAEAISATYIRIDTIEQALLRSHLDIKEVIDAGYQAGYGVADDNLKLGRTVIADSVNPIKLTRDDWREIAVKNIVEYIEIEVICSDKAQHKKRIENRKADIEGHKLPNWQEVAKRDYQEWDRDRIIIDTGITNESEIIENLIRNFRT